MQPRDSSKYRFAVSRLFAKYKDKKLENVEYIRRGDRPKFSDMTLHYIYTVPNRCLPLRDKSMKCFTLLGVAERFDLSISVKQTDDENAVNFVFQQDLYATHSETRAVICSLWTNVASHE